ncbi:hypothetical protein IV203_008392 [Nitzschia inconspicua]|uniref:DEK-C domain-containing protein n=1 Tax=Nitzschia inconspicua TaxID=303405 RepID=A0A9K3KZK4_9STRA|nr:hypothetical protein IV203_008392 [Nitzschia inconspicua]
MPPAPPNKKAKTAAGTSEEKTSTEEKGADVGKRKRRESTGYQPEDFTMASERSAMAAKETKVPPGRGFKLRDIPVIKAGIEKIPANHEDLVSAYTFVFGPRPKVTKKEMKERLLEFNGYLPALPKGKYDDDEMDREEDKYEARYATRAYKLNIAQLRKLCDFFHVDVKGEGKKPLNKDETVEKLLDFLGEPDVGLTVGESSSTEVVKVNKKKPNGKKTSTDLKPKPAKKKKVADPFEAIKNHPKGEKPSDKALRQWAKAYVVCFDMDQATTKHAILTASDKFGVDLAPQKAKIKDMLAEEM